MLRAKKKYIAVHRICRVDFSVALRDIELKFWIQLVWAEVVHARPQLSPNPQIVPKLSLFVQICYKNLKTLIYFVRDYSKPVMSHYLYF
jgi:hypothetical protein